MTVVEMDVDDVELVARAEPTAMEWLWLDMVRSVQWGRVTAIIRAGVVETVESTETFKRREMPAQEQGNS